MAMPEGRTHSQDEHGVAVTIEAVFVVGRGPVGLEHEGPAGKGADEHEER